MKIASVSVTFNRLELLKEHIEALRMQTRPIDKIIVVNNGSTDGTREWLESQSDLHIITQNNQGSAGGFYSGMKVAFEAGYDWIWVMDDDVEPIHKALETLLHYKDVSDCIHPSRFFEDGSKFDFNFELNTSNGMIQVKRKDYHSKKTNYFVTNTACFEGMLINSRLVKKIGFPNPQFFIVGDDTHYGYLASKETNVIFVNEPLLIKKIKQKLIKIRKNTFIINNKSFYYFRFRNQYLINQLLIADKKLDLLQHYRAYYLSAFFLSLNMLYGLKITHFMSLAKGVFENFKKSKNL